jgi:hypothetical protein
MLSFGAFGIDAVQAERAGGAPTPKLLQRIARSSTQPAAVLTRQGSRPGSAASLASTGQPMDAPGPSSHPIDSFGTPFAKSAGTAPPSLQPSPIKVGPRDAGASTTPVGSPMRQPPVGEASIHRRHFSTSDAAKGMFSDLNPLS